MSRCNECHGTGHRAPAFIDSCKCCDGKGYITKDDIKRLTNTCYKCGGQFGPKEIDHYQSRMTSLHLLTKVEITFKRCLKCNWRHYA